MEKNQPQNQKPEPIYSIVRSPSPTPPRPQQEAEAEQVPQVPSARRRLSFTPAPQPEEIQPQIENENLQSENFQHSENFELKGGFLIIKEEDEKILSTFSDDLLENLTNYCENFFQFLLNLDTQNLDENTYFTEKNKNIITFLGYLLLFLAIIYGVKKLFKTKSATDM